MEDVNNISKNSLRVKEKGFMGSNHKVTGEELNKVIEDNSKKIIEINNIVYEQKCLMEKLCNILNALDDKYARLYIEIIINQNEELFRRFQNIETEFSRQINEWYIKFEDKKEEIAQLQRNNDELQKRVQELSKKSFFDSVWYKAAVGVAAFVALGLSIISVFSSKLEIVELGKLFK